MLQNKSGYAEERDPASVAAVELGGVRTVLYVPMLKENELVGAFTLSRQEVRPFTEEQIGLVKNFAAQAVIAIENARLLNELRQSLEQQTATSKVLEVISRSAFDLKAVFETVAESSVRLCGSERANIFRFDGEVLRVVTAVNAPRQAPGLARTKSNSSRPAQRCRPCRTGTPNGGSCRRLGRSGAHLRGKKYRAVPDGTRGADP